MRRYSLTSRLIQSLVLVQIGVVVASMAAWMILSPFVTFTDVAAASARKVVEGAIAPDASGRLAIASTAALERYVADRPGLVFGVFGRDQGVLPGSSPELAGHLSRFGLDLPTGGKLDFIPFGNAPRQLIFSSERTPFGDLVFATAGDVFRREDLPSFVLVYMLQLVPLFGPALLGAVLIVPVVLRRGLMPMRRAAAEVARMDFSSLDGRLGRFAGPAELRPFVEAIDALLERLSDGAARQRLFTANAAHELRTPVAILQARIDALPESRSKLSLKGDASRLGVLIDQLLAVARLGQRDIAIDESVELVGLVRTIVADCAPLAIRSGREIGFMPDVEACRLSGNGRAIASALTNLIDNALRAEPEGGTVQILAGIAHDETVVRAWVAIVDHGSGIAYEDRKAIFEPFWRKDERKPGTGLGLAIVREIARLHGGDVSVRTTPGGGATFRLELPLIGSDRWRDDMIETASRPSVREVQPLSGM